MLDKHCLSGSLKGVRGGVRARKNWLRSFSRLSCKMTHVVFPIWNWLTAPKQTMLDQGNFKSNILIRGRQNNRLVYTTSARPKNSEDIRVVLAGLPRSVDAKEVNCSWINRKFLNTSQEEIACSFPSEMNAMYSQGIDRDLDTDAAAA